MATFRDEHGRTVRSTIKAVVGRRVRLLGEEETRLVKLPAGTVLVIDGSASRSGEIDGLTLSTVACAHCGVAVYVRGVPARRVVLLDEETRKP